MKKLLFLLLLLPGLASAQTVQRTSKLYYNYDVSSTSYIYCRYVGANGSPTGSELQGYGLIKTTGSSATLDELDSASDSFTGMAVGDLLTVRLPNGTVYNRRIITFTSVSQVVVDAAVDLGTTGVAFTWLRQQCGTTAADGWIDVAGFWRLNFQRVLTTINATSIQTQMECRLSGLGTQVLDTSSVTVAGTYNYSVETGVWDACRMGVKVTTDGGIQSITGGIAFLSTEQVPVESPLDIRVVKTTVSPAELMNLVAAPKQLVPAPGAGYFAQVFRVVVNRAAGTAYTVGANVLQIGCIDGGTQRRQLYMDITAGFVGAGNLFLSTAESTHVFNGPTGTSGTTLESATPVIAPGTPLDVSNKPLMLWATPADLSGGTGNVTFTTYYFIVPVR